jgi:hypothetical protein
MPDLMRDNLTKEDSKPADVPFGLVASKNVIRNAEHSIDEEMHRKLTESSISARIN